MGQIIEDVRPLLAGIQEPDQIKQITQLAIGVYNPLTAERLVATDEAGRPLLHDALLVDLKR